jgi:hypothetical protein
MSLSFTENVAEFTRRVALRDIRISAAIFKIISHVVPR